MKKGNSFIFLETKGVYSFRNSLLYLSFSLSKKIIHRSVLKAKDDSRKKKKKAQSDVFNHVDCDLGPPHPSTWAQLFVEFGL